MMQFAATPGGCVAACSRYSSLIKAGGASINTNGLPIKSPIEACGDTGLYDSIRAPKLWDNLPVEI